MIHLHSNYINPLNMHVMMAIVNDVVQKTLHEILNEMNHQFYFAKYMDLQHQHLNLQYYNIKSI